MRYSMCSKPNQKRIGLMNTASKEKETPTRQVVAHNFKARLEAERWSEHKLAAALGLTPSYVNRRAIGETELSATDLAMFSEILNMRIQDFFKTDRRTLDYGSDVSNIIDLFSRELVS